jgi:septum formation protein
MSLILASASPRRAELLGRAGFTFEVSPVDLDESPWPSEAPAAHVTRLAEAKAGAGAARHPGRLVLGADTIVVVGGRILGKPASDGEAAEMLGCLSGRWHEVMTAVALRRDERGVSETAVTRVHFLPLSPAEVAWYVASAEPRDKAGAYAVQGLASRFIDRIEGSCSNVVGLPMDVVYRLLRVMEAAADGPGRAGA